jgi:cytoskeletal protein CcmA (bactofilin family)
MFRKQTNDARDTSSVSIPSPDRSATTATAAAPAPVRAEVALGRTTEFGREERSRLIVGPNIKLKGVEITDCDTLVVEGRVEASMDSRIIQIAEGGVFTGTVAIDRAEIRGKFEGEMTVRDRLVVHGTGRIVGKIRYGRLAVEEGGEITGDLAALPRSETRTASTPASTSASAPATAPETDPVSSLQRPKREPFSHPPTARVESGGRDAAE